MRERGPRARIRPDRPRLHRQGSTTGPAGVRQERHLLALAADLVIVVILGAPFFAIWSPPGLVGREIMRAVFYEALAIEGAVILLVLVLNLIAPRLFCRSLCPLGGMLAVLGAKRPLNVRWNRDTCTGCGACDPGCPMGLTPGEGESESV